MDFLKWNPGRVRMPPSSWMERDFPEAGLPWGIATDIADS